MVNFVERGSTASAIALAASVAPFTKMSKNKDNDEGQKRIGNHHLKKVSEVIIRYLSNHFHNRIMIIEVSRSIMFKNIRIAKSAQVVSYALPSLL